MHLLGMPYLHRGLTWPVGFSMKSMSIIEKMAIAVNGYYILQTIFLYSRFAGGEMYTGMGKELPSITKIVVGPLPVWIILISILLVACMFVPALKKKTDIRIVLLSLSSIVNAGCSQLIAHGAYLPIMDMARGM